MPKRCNAVILATVVLAITSTSKAIVAQAPAPGTYRVWLCAEVCAPSDSSLAIGVATIVIVNDRTAAKESEQSLVEGVPPIWGINETGKADNVCFSVSRREKRVGSEEFFFGIQQRGRTAWKYAETAGFSMLVYQSPDAGYSLRWTEPGPITRGEGWSYGWAGNTPYHRNAYFAARRIGEPDTAQCI